MNSKIISDLIRRFGCKISVSKDDSTSEHCAFIQPLRYNNKLYLDGSSLTQGLYDGSYCLMIAPAELKLDKPFEDYIIECEAMNRRFTVKKSEMYYFNDRPLYLWAVLGNYNKTEVDALEL